MSRAIAFILMLVIITLSFVTPAHADRAEVDLRLYGVRRANQLQAGYLQSIDARVGDEIEFSLGVVNPSSPTAHDVRVNVYLPFGMRVVADSIKINGIPFSSNTLSGGIAIGQIREGEQKTVIFRATPGSNREGFYDIQGQISGGNIGTITKYITINISPRMITPVPTPLLTPTSIAKTKVAPKIVYAAKEELTIVKVGRNVTAGQQVPTKEISARPGDELEFFIQITAISAKTIENVTIKDLLPEQVDYVFNSTRLDKQVVSDQIFREGFSLGHLQPKETKTVHYRARLLPINSFQAKETELKNVSEARATNADLVTDAAHIFVNKNADGFLGGVLIFTGSAFYIYVLILLAALTGLFLTFWIQEKRRPRVIPPI